MFINQVSVEIEQLRIRFSPSAASEWYHYAQRNPGVCVCIYTAS